MQTELLDPPPAAITRGGGGYVEVAYVRDVDGILGIISRRMNGPPIHSIGLFKEFVRNGVTEKSSFWPTSMYEAVQRVLNIAVPACQELEKTAMAEYTREDPRGLRR